MVLLSVSCASDSNKRKSSSTPAIKPLSQRIDEKNGYQKDANGNWQAQAEKRSSFEAKGPSAYFKGDYAKKDYKTTNYSKKSWWGNKDYQTKEYAGSTDGSRFQKSSPLNGKSARNTGKSANLTKAYKTGDYATKSAREQDTKNIKKFSDTETDIRRKVYPTPDIIDWTQQRSLSIDQSKGILGR
jgi:hypothetical protein